MQIDKLSEAWLFEGHSKSEIMNWIKQLEYFYFQRDWGGFANDGDMFVSAITFSDKIDLINKMEQLGLKLNSFPIDIDKPKAGQSYTTEEYKKFKNPINVFPDLEQPGNSIIFGQKVHIWVYEKSFHITVSGTKDQNLYEVSEDDFKVCLEIEKQFEKLNWKTNLDKSLENNVCCISRAKYPELF